MPSREKVKSVALAASLLACFTLSACLALVDRQRASALQQAISAHRAGEYDRAQERYQQAYTSGDDPRISLGGRAECLYYLGRLGEAEDVCNSLSRLVPNAGRANYVRYLIYRKLGRPDADEQLLQAARHGDPVAIKKLERR